MRAMQKPSREIPDHVRGMRDYVDIDTIRRRVARIKNEWSDETIRARANEGARRRDELECILLDVLTDTSASEESWDLKQHGFSLVG